MARPRDFKTAKEMEIKIEAYFQVCEEKSKPLTMTGLALTLEVSRQTIHNYQSHYGKEFLDTIKKAKLMCENYAEESLWNAKNVAGVIFNLKNNYGWTDKKEVEHSGEITERKIVDFANIRETITSSRVLRSHTPSSN